MLLKKGESTALERNTNSKADKAWMGREPLTKHTYTHNIGLIGTEAIIIFFLSLYS